MNIIAVIVTRNRLSLLARCINHVLSQTGIGPTKLVIVNNGSTDGTFEMLEELATRDSRVMAVHQQNKGGAGGFSAGFEVAFAQGADAVWCMDDDGYPSPDCLERLYLYHKSVSNNDVLLNPLVIQEDLRERTAFVIAGTNSVEVIKQTFPDVIRNRINNFNGTYVSRSCFEKIGNIKSEMFIWGDETEYLLRALRHRVHVATVVGSEYFHPAARGVVAKVAFGLLGHVHVKPIPLGYYSFRNLGYLAREYPGSFPAFRIFVKHVVYFVLRAEPRRALRFMRAFYDGYRADFSINYI